MFGILPERPQDYSLRKGTVYTLVVKSSSTFQPSIASVKSAFDNSAFGRSWIETISVERPLFSPEYYIKFRSRLTTDLAKMMQVFSANPPIAGMNIVGIEGAAYAPSIISTSITSPITAVTSEIKTFAILGIGLMAAFYLLPIVSKIAKRKR